ncbi:MAG TPA: hypothetical protein VKZ94_18155 [Advenella sp.]|nr:hypothetical protein [Advenella sp.]
MPINRLCRLSLMLCLASFIAGCSGGGRIGSLGGECAWYRSSCSYEGPYEADEKDYAEEEAARLNRAQSSRLGGGGWFW